MKLIILGTDDFGKTINDVVEQISHYNEIVMLKKPEDFEDYINQDTEFYPAISDNELRYNWILKLDASGAQIATIIHPSAYVSPKAVIGKGSVILPHATVNNDAVVTYGCVVDIGAILDHHILLEMAFMLIPEQ